MQIKTTTRYHYLPNQIAKTKKVRKYQELVRIGVMRILTDWWIEWKFHVSIWKVISQYFLKPNMYMNWPRNSILRNWFFWKTCNKRHLLECQKMFVVVFFHDRPKLETPPISINSKFILKSKVYTNKRILYSNKSNKILI